MQLGHKLPHYIHTAIHQAELFNPESDIYLIVHARNAKILRSKNLFSSQVHIIDTTQLPLTENHKAFAPIALTEMKYWRYTLERFYILEEFMRAFAIDELIQLESDNLVYRNLTELLPVFRSVCPEIGIPYISDKRCTPGVVYIGNVDALAEYNARIPAQIARYNAFSDMDFFADFGRETSMLKSLPSIPKKYVDENHTFTSLLGITSHSLEHFYAHCEEFGGVFDALPYGVFLDGVSGVHSEYKLRKRLEESAIDPSVFTYLWKRDDLGRQRLFIKLGDEEWPIYVLHVHSKDLRKFVSDR